PLPIHFLHSFPTRRSSDLISRTYVLELDETLRGRLASILDALRADRNVEFAEEDKVVSTNLTPNDPYFSSSGSWGQNYPDLWGIDRKSTRLNSSHVAISYA